MVISAVLGLPIAFGSGELSGAGFGPNYTILMKLGYEFYAPRILDEMQKKPNRSFEDTEYWRLFQKHLKSYTDKVLEETIDKLVTFPIDILENLQDRFGKFLDDANINVFNPPKDNNFDILDALSKLIPKVPEAEARRDQSGIQKQRQDLEEALKNKNVPDSAIPPLLPSHDDLAKKFNIPSPDQIA